MKWLATGCWILSIAGIALFLKGTNRGCEGDCNQGRKTCNCRKEDD